jgi:hypothetical protein
MLVPKQITNKQTNNRPHNPNKDAKQEQTHEQTNKQINKQTNKQTAAQPEVGQDFHCPNKPTDKGRTRKTKLKQIQRPCGGCG